MWSIAAKEFRELLFSPKYILTFAVGALLIFISVFNGWSIYDAERAAAAEAKAAAEERMGDAPMYRYLSYTTPRYPEKSAIFDIGISGLIGSKASVRSSGRPSINDNRYERDPVIAVFGELDLAFTVTYILSVFAFLFSFSSINGEREAGTLQLMLSNSIKRPSVVLGKLVGGFLPITLLFLLPFLMTLVALLILADVNFGPGEWLKIGLMALAFLLYLLLFHSMGVAMSALTRSSFVSFLLCLFLWVAAIAVVPKVTTNIASLVSPSMSALEMEKRQRDFWDQYRYEYPKQMKKYLRDHPMTEEEFKAKEREFYDTVHEQMEKRNEEFGERLTREYRMKRMNMLGTATLLSSISPTSSMNYTVHSLSNTGPRLLEVFEDSLKVYRKDFLAYAKAMAEEHEKEEEQRENRYSFGTREDGTMKVDINEDFQPPKLDLSGMPRFRMILPDAVEMTGRTLPYFGMLAIYSLLFFALAFVAFLRYDVR